MLTLTMKKSRSLSVREEKANAWTHGLMALLLVLSAPVVLAYRLHPAGNTGWRENLGVLVFILCLVLMFSASAVYHSLPSGTADKRFWNRIDHIAIFLAIAGTYTPIALSVIGGRLGWLIFALQWLLVLAGILFKVFCFKKSRLSSLVSVLLYLLMGWAVALCLPVFAARAQPANFWLVVAGGLFYTSGLIFFARGRPFDHVTWHGFVMAGAFCHFLAIIFFL